MASSSSPEIITFKEFCEFATEHDFPQPSRKKYDAFVQANASPQFNIRNRQEAAMFFAHVIQESGGYVDLAEQNLNSRIPGAYGNHPAAPGEKYYGRGYIQLSWWYNYEDASKALFGHDPKIVKTKDALVKNPSSIETDELLAWHTALWFWCEQVRKKCDLRKFRFGETTKIINSIECENPLNAKTPKEKEDIEELNGKAQKRFKYYEKNLEVLGIKTKPIEGGCYN